MNYKKIITIFISIFLILNISIFPTFAATLDDYNISITDVGSAGEFDNVRFWQRLNYMQAYVFPSYSYYYDDITAELSPNLGYIPVNIPQYIITPKIYGEDEAPADLKRIIPNFLYEYQDATTSQYSMQGGINLNELSANSNGYGGYMEYTYTSVFGGTFDPNLRVLLVGDTYSYNATHAYNGSVNEVDITGLVITNPSDSSSCVVYYNGVMKWAGEAVEEIVPHGSVAMDGYVILNPGDSVRFDDTIIEGETGGDVPVMTCFSGQIMIRHGNSSTKPVVIHEEFNDYFSMCSTFSDTNLVGITDGSDGKNGGADITSVFNAQYYGTYFSNPDYGALDINSNGVYSTEYYSSVNVNVPQEIAWGGMFDWIVDSAGAFMGFEIAPGWNIGILLSIAVGLAVVIWALKVFLGG